MSAGIVSGALALASVGDRLVRPSRKLARLRHGSSEYAETAESGQGTIFENSAFSAFSAVKKYVGQILLQFRHPRSPVIVLQTRKSWTFSPDSFKIVAF